MARIAKFMKVDTNIILGLIGLVTGRNDMMEYKDLISFILKQFGIAGRRGRTFVAIFMLYTSRDEK